MRIMPQPIQNDDLCVRELLLELCCRCPNTLLIGEVRVFSAEVGQRWHVYLREMLVQAWCQDHTRRTLHAPRLFEHRIQIRQVVRFNRMQWIEAFKVAHPDGATHNRDAQRCCQQDRHQHVRWSRDHWTDHDQSQYAFRMLKRKQARRCSRDRTGNQKDTLDLFSFQNSLNISRKSLD